MRRAPWPGALSLVRALVPALFLAACTEPAPAPPPPDPCVALRAEYDAVRARGRCASELECVAAPGIGEPPAPGAMGERSAPPCGSAVHANSLGDLERVVERWRAASCGPVGPAGSTACTQWSHGARRGCLDGRCEALF